MDDGQERLTSREVARRLGVKIETVYAYASRGLLHSQREPGRRGSTFDPAEVEQLRGSGRAGLRGGEISAYAEARPPVEVVPRFNGGLVGGDGAVRTGAVGPSVAVTAAKASGGSGAGGVGLWSENDPGLPAVRTRVTVIRDGRLYYRGVDAVELAAHRPFEQVAGWLWHGRFEPRAPFAVPVELAAMLQQVGALVPARARLTDRLRIAVSLAAANDPLRFDLREDSVLLTARTLVAALVAALPGPPSVLASAAGDAAPLAERLWQRLTGLVGEQGAVSCLDQALGLLADHDLAVSTFAARVAASARADPYAVVAAGLAALDGPLHGGASRLAHRLIAEVLAGDDAVGVLSERLRAGQPVPGFGHPAYPDGDPRARALLQALSTVPAAQDACAAARQLVEAAGRERALRPNIDLALAVLTLAADMPADAGEVIFAVARTAGWLAHALEEYQERPLRLRPRGVYVGSPVVATA
ncbi:citrate/2-methylcitrate synthase [Frankia sp. R82]|uniref:citrate/2-methylcitrate synthase n=1 Tax=Frankia sp. R82 TaxID=2950553 RepID=UPI002044BBF3|nr:citrate/2-methylcitrate synthase [Frankia sp. R82]MCM3883298.1 MerR family transcriptional regulator [Frankia sp. R82]